MCEMVFPKTLQGKSFFLSFSFETPTTLSWVCDAPFSSFKGLDLFSFLLPPNLQRFVVDVDSIDLTTKVGTRELGV